MKLKSPFLIKPGSKVKLSQHKTSVHPGVKSESHAKDILAQHTGELDELQNVFYASQKKALLIVLQGMDTAGKDGTIRHIFSGVNPQGCQVASFKVPTSLELRHDFLWRCHAEVPPRGIIGIFNRSHYEDVLSPRVHGAISKETVRQRMDSINAWEQTLVDNDVVVLKFFLHISQKEQTERLQARIDSPDKHWKLSAGDFAERLYWDQYQSAYEDILRHTSKADAPWFVIPADHKWYRNVAISKVLADTMRGLKLKYPAPTFDPTGIDLAKQSGEEVAKLAESRSNPHGVDPEKDSVRSGKTKH